MKKQANWWDTFTGGSPTTQSDQAILDEQTKQKAIGDILATLGVATAVGVGARGAIGARHLLGRPTMDLRRSPGPSVLQIPTPVYANKKEEEKAKLLGYKQASPWWTIPALTSVGVGGVYGGYKLMDWMLTRKRKEDLEAEIQVARDKYRQALLEQYNPGNVPSADQVPQMSPSAIKTASLLKELGDFTDAMEKEARSHIPAETMEKEADWKSNSVGILATLGGLLALGSGVASYNLTKSRSTNKLLEDAIKQRERERWARRPPEIYAVPQPVRLDRAGELHPTGTPPDLSVLS